MKQILTLSLSLVICLVMNGQSLSHSGNGITAEVEFYSPEIVRIVKYPAENVRPEKNSLSVTMQPRNDFKLRKSGSTIRSERLKVGIDTKTGLISFYDSKGKLLIKEGDAGFEMRTVGADKGSYIVKQSFRPEPDEPLYGLGIMQNGKLNLRGENRRIEQSNKEDYANIIQSIKGYGIFWDNYSPTMFNDSSEETVFTSEVGDCVDYYFIYGGNADKVVAGIRELTGDAPLFPIWSYGFWQSRERYKSQDELLEVVRRYRALGIPFDGIIQDWQYWAGNYLWNAMDFLNAEFPKPQQMIDEVHANNAKLMISIWASFGPQTLQFKELKEKGLLLGDVKTWPPSGSGLWPPRQEYPSGVRLYDPYSKEARDIYWKYLRNLADMDIDGWWMDSTDPDHEDKKDADYETITGMGSWRKVRNAFPLMTVGGVYDNMRKDKGNRRAFIMTRSYFAGIQRYGANVWTGDIGSSWDDLRKQVPAGLNFTLTGAPHFNTDIGGFFPGGYNKSYGNSTATSNTRYHELFVRWMQFGIYNPMMRSHGTELRREIYYFGKEGDAAYDAIVSAIRQRYDLLPYIYSTSWDVTTHRGSFMRALFMDFAGDRNTWDLRDQYMFGKSIMVAPVLHAQYTDEKTSYTEEPADFNATKSDKVYFPAGCEWYDIWTNERIAGGQELEVETRFDRAPVYVREGSIIPVGPKVQYATEKDWSSLEIRVYPGADASFTLYEDEGDGYGYEQGQCSTIEFRWNEKKHTLDISKREGVFPGMLQQRTFRIVLVDADTPAFGTETVEDRSVEYSGEAISITLR